MLFRLSLNAGLSNSLGLGDLRVYNYFLAKVTDGRRFEVHTLTLPIVVGLNFIILMFSLTCLLGKRVKFGTDSGLNYCVILRPKASSM